jgi:hypothetical protein
MTCQTVLRTSNEFCLRPSKKPKNIENFKMAQSDAKKLLTDRFRCPEDITDFKATSGRSHDLDYFQLGSDSIYFEQCSSVIPAALPADAGPVARQHVPSNGSTVRFPFDPVQVVDNLRFERYTVDSAPGGKKTEIKNAIRNLYYLARPFMPVNVRKHLQKIYLRGWDKVPFPTWPVDRTVENIFEQRLVFAMRSRNLNRVPFVWFWPDGARSCAMMTHDVETSSGADFCPRLMDLNESFGITSSFQIVPEERYPVSETFLEKIQKRGFEINVHDLNHDGHLFSDRIKFALRAERINRYARRFGALGFRSAGLYRNVDWYDSLDFSYDMSVPNVAHLDPQRGGCCTVFPFFIGEILELPVTTTQDYSLFHILNDYSTRLWKEQISLIQADHGLISFIIHPDYIISERAQRVYVQLLRYLCELRSQGETWIGLPREVNAWWRMRSDLKLVNVGGSWRIEGEGHERARIAYATIVNNALVYEIDPPARKEDLIDLRLHQSVLTKSDQRVFLKKYSE